MYSPTNRFPSADAGTTCSCHSPAANACTRAATSSYVCHENGPTEPSARNRVPKHGRDGRRAAAASKIE